MKNKGFGHLKTRLFTIKTSKNVGFGGPWYIYLLEVWDDFFYFCATHLSPQAAQPSARRAVVAAQESQTAQVVLAAQSVTWRC